MRFWISCVWRRRVGFERTRSCVFEEPDCKVSTSAAISSPLESAGGMGLSGQVAQLELSNTNRILNIPRALLCYFKPNELSTFSLDN